MNSFFEVSFTYFISIFIILVFGLVFYKLKYQTIPSPNWFTSIITLTVTALSPLLAVVTYDSWKKQHVINQQEAIIVRVLDQLDKVDLAAKDYFKPIHISTVMNDNEKYANDIYSAESQLTFELKKLETLLEKSKEIDFKCSEIEKINVMKFRERIEKHYNYLRFYTYPVTDSDRAIRRAIIKNNENNLFFIFGRMNVQWNHLSNDIRSIVLDWSGIKLLSRMEESKEKAICKETNYNHDEYTKKILERASKNLNSK